MSEVQTRPAAPRGRGSSRGGRASFGSRGGRGPRVHATNGEKSDVNNVPSIEEDPEVTQLKQQFGVSKFNTIKEMFPEWTDEDIVFALQETNGDLENTVSGMADGSITKWGEVSKNKKDRSRSKANDTTGTPLGETTNNPRTGRGGRGAQEGTRGRGRGSERARGGRGRGPSAAHTNGSRTKEPVELSIPTEESNAWDTAKKDEAESSDAKPTETWAITATETASSTAATVAQITSSIIPEGVKKSWASILKPAIPVLKKPVVEEKLPEELPPAEEAEEKAVSFDTEVGLPPSSTEIVEPEEQTTPLETPAGAEVELTPSKDELTETNLEQVPDISAPNPTATAASTAASSWDPRSGPSATTPLSALQQQPAVARPPASGFAASAQKATGTSSKPGSYQRRVLDQEEAVRMPGNREVDRTAVHFGMFNLGDEDVDGDREEPETRAQPPQHSPITHPRASLPPAPAQSTGLPASLPSPKETSGSLPAPAHVTAAPGLPSPQPLASAQNISQQGSQASSQYPGYGRYGQPGAQDPPAAGQKAYDPFGQQAPATQNQYEVYSGQQGQAQPQQPSTAFSSAPNDYSSYYTSEQQRNAYQNYYNQYGQPQGGQAQQEGATPQQRATSAYTAPQAENPSNSGPQAQSRYGTAGEGQTSGHTTPNPSAQSQHAGQPAQSQQAHPAQPQAQPGQYPYNHPYYQSPYYTAYMNQYQQGGYGQGNYGAGPYGAKGGMYNQPQHGYGMSPQAPYDHTASPAAGSFGQPSAHGRESALAGGLGEYGRAGSQQPQPAGSLGGSGAFGGMNDSYGRGSSYQGQSQNYGQQGAQQAASDDLKPFGDGKSANGPSPLLSNAARPGSAANSVPGQSGLPPPQSTQQGYGGYPSHLQQQQALHGSQSSSQYGALGAGAHQSGGQGHQSSQYGGYGAQGFGGNSYYGNNQQQRGGWGNNYGH